MDEHKLSKGAKEAVYSGSRNLYPHMATAAKSLIANSPVERVWFLIEDERFPIEVPDIIETMDVSKQKFFPPTCANITTGYTYMSLMRTTYAKLFPDLDRVLQLDVDTVVVDGIGELWEMDLGKAWFAACPEKNGKYKPYGPRYYNAGVMMFNLRQIREECADSQAIALLNATKLPYIDQDAWNMLGNDRVIDLPERYNECYMVGFTPAPAICHYAGHGNDWTNLSDTRTPRLEYLKAYREMSWDEAMELHEKHVAQASGKAVKR